ncbi:MAG: DUF481 domain-containing protein [Pseudomonadota bacterium]
MRLLAALLCLLALAAPSHAQDAALPEPLQALLEAAAAAPDEERFGQAVELMALTRPAEEILAGAAAISADHAAQAAARLGLTGALADGASDTRFAAAPEAAEPAPSASAEPRPGWRGAPAQALSLVSSAQSDLWEGSVKLGFRQDSGNSDQLDYTVGFQAERTLSVWGFKSLLEYAYSEADGAVGRDAFLASAQIDREIGDRWTVFIGSRYEQDQLSGFDWTGLVDAGLGYRILTDEALSWQVQAGPAARFIQPVTGDAETEAALSLGSDFDWRISETLLFSADTSALIADSSRFEQAFSLETALGELWSLQLNYRYSYEFEPEPGFTEEDTRTDLSLVRRF